MMANYWRNDYCRLYEVVEDDCPQLRSMLGVWQVLDKKDGRGRVTFYGHYAYDDGWMKDGAAYELVMFEPGIAPDMYDEGQVVMRLVNCKKRLRWLKTPVAVSPRDSNYSIGYLSADCDIEWIEVESD